MFKKLDDTHYDLNGFILDTHYLKDFLLQRWMDTHKNLQHTPARLVHIFLTNLDEDIEDGKIENIQHHLARLTWWGWFIPDCAFVGNKNWVRRCFDGFVLYGDYLLSSAYSGGKHYPVKYYFINTPDKIYESELQSWEK